MRPLALAVALGLVACATPRPGTGPRSPTPTAAAANAHTGPALAWGAGLERLAWQPFTPDLDAFLACAARGQGEPCLPYAEHLDARATATIESLRGVPAGHLREGLVELHADARRPFLAGSCDRLTAALARRRLRAGWCASRPGGPPLQIAVTPALLARARAVMASALASPAEATRVLAALKRLQGRTVTAQKQTLVCTGPRDSIHVYFVTYDGTPVRLHSVSRSRVAGGEMVEATCNASVASARLPAALKAPAPAPALAGKARAGRAGRVAGWVPVRDARLAAYARCAAAGKGPSCLPFARDYYREEAGILARRLPELAAQLLPQVLGDAPLAGAPTSCKARELGLLARLAQAGRCVADRFGGDVSTVTFPAAVREALLAHATGAIRARVEALPHRLHQVQRHVVCATADGQTMVMGRILAALGPKGEVTYAVHADGVTGPGNPCGP